MANKLAGQRAKFSRAYAQFYSSDDDASRQRAIELMAQVLRDAPAYGFSETDVTQAAEVPGAVRHAERQLSLSGGPSGTDEESDEAHVALLRQVVDLSDVVEVGLGAESVYAYGYACLPDRLKIGVTSGDPVARVATQISTSTPEKPKLSVLIRSDRARRLERALHAVLEFRDRRIVGGGAEWFRVSRDELLALAEDLGATTDESPP